MDFIKRNAKRIAIDAAGYLLLIAAALTGWLPGPGGIPLAIAGLGLLSINNVWARRIRDYALSNGGKLVKLLFPNVAWLQWVYDTIVVLCFALAAFLAWQHAAWWQVSLAIVLFFMAVTVALLNRDRWDRIKQRKKA